MDFRAGARRSTSETQGKFRTANSTATGTPRCCRCARANAIRLRSAAVSQRPAAARINGAGARIFPGAFVPAQPLRLVPRGAGHSRAPPAPPERGCVAATSRSADQRGGRMDFSWRVRSSAAAAADPARRGTQPRSADAIRGRACMGGAGWFRLFAITARMCAGAVGFDLNCL